MNQSNDQQSIALREWAVTVEALGEGQQILLMRKGGIHEETRHFQVQSEQFYLFPSYEHQKEKLLKPAFQDRVQHDPNRDQVEMKYFAHLYEDIELSEEKQLQQIIDHHIWTDDFAFGRLKWKKKSPLYLLLVRVYQLANPFSVPLGPAYRGCKSWLNIPGNPQPTELKPVMEEEDFQTEVKAIKQKLFT